MKTKITQVPTNIITGFLGTGKTSTIEHLLTFKPIHERWAILVNEFGTVGIDGTHYQSKHKEEGGVFVREVPGGCMCCISGLPMQIALNVLLKLSKPHRLLIEPSGLGHPIEVLSLLKSQYYKDVLDIQKVITLIDPQQFIQEKYFDHTTYQQQLEISDISVINKTDLCTVQELATFKRQWVGANFNENKAIYVTHGHVDMSILKGTNNLITGTIDINSNNTISDTKDMINLPQIPAHIGYLMSSRFDEGFYAISWRYLKRIIFDKIKLLTWLKTLNAERIKGVLIIDQGVIGINFSNGHLQVEALEACIESRLEIITKEINSEWQKSINCCISKI